MTDNRFVVAFTNPKTGATRARVVELSDAEVVAAGAHPCPDLAAEAFALRRAYRLVPAGFLHDGLEPV